MEEFNKSLVVVSNRLPVTLDMEGGDWQIKPSAGGLVTALAPIVKKTHGKWIGWAGSSEDAPIRDLMAEYSREQAYQLVPVDLSENEIARYYRGFSNNTIWPLFHDLLGKFSFDLEDWRMYHDINQRFAKYVIDNSTPEDIIWIHDYQLMCVGHYLREMGAIHHLNFFLHIPFPSLDLFRRLPWNRELLVSLLSYDHIGFQTPMDRRNFISCIKWLVPEATRSVRRRRSTINYEGRNIRVGYYPISIDFKEFNDLAKTREVADAAWYLRENIKAPMMALGLDRLDYTKGIPERFLAIERLLEKYPEMHRKITLLQIVVPSRLNVPEYQSLKNQLDGLAGRINSRFGQHGWTPIDYQFRKLDRVQLVGYYRSADIALITPLRDGMNLVAKEYCASSIDNHGVLILSEFAGAAAQLAKGALMVNPFDLDGTADAIYAAYLMPEEERAQRMKVLRAEVRRYDVKQWVNWFFGSLRRFQGNSPNDVEYDLEELIDAQG